MDFAHCVTVKWTLVVKGKPLLTDKPARKTHKSNRRAAGTSSLGSFFREATSPQDDKIILIFRIHYLFIYVFLLFYRSPEMLCFLALGQIICLFMYFYCFTEVQKCYVFWLCALCKTGSSQWSVFETDITMSWINTNTVNKHFFASSATHRSTSRYIVHQTVWQWIE